MSVLKLLVQFSLGLLLVVTSLQLIRRDEWWIRMSDFPHIQITIITFCCLVGNLIVMDALYWEDVALAVGGSLAFAYQLLVIFPYTPFRTKQSKSCQCDEGHMTISILESNVFMNNCDFTKLIGLIEQRQPDLILALETDEKWKVAMTTLEEKYMHTVLCPQENTYGMLFYSKYEIVESSIVYLVEENIPSIEATIKMPNEVLVKLYIVHPQPPSPTENYRSTERDAELIVIGQKAKHCDLPVIVAGDLNDVAWSHTTRLFQRISGLLDPRIGRGFYNTFHADYPMFRWPLDHLFHSEHFLVRKIERLPNIGSDHFPMYTELCLAEKQAFVENERPESADLQDYVESIKTLKKVNVLS